MPTDAELLKAYLADRDVPCPKCSYNLRGCVAEKCPECGVKIVLSIQRVEPQVSAFLLAVIGLSGGLGFHAILLAWFVITRLFTTTVLSTEEAIPMMVAAPLLAASLMWCIVKRGWFFCARSRVPWTVAALAILAAAASGAWFFWAV